MHGTNAQNGRSNFVHSQNLYYNLNAACIQRSNHIIQIANNEIYMVEWCWRSEKYGHLKGKIYAAKLNCDSSAWYMINYILIEIYRILFLKIQIHCQFSVFGSDSLHNMSCHRFWIRNVDDLLGLVHLIWFKSSTNKKNHFKAWSNISSKIWNRNPQRLLPIRTK